jgi:hypothetical protein
MTRGDEKYIHTHTQRGEGQHIKQLGCLFLLQQAISIYKSYRLCFNLFFLNFFVLFLFVSLWCSTHHGPVLIKTRPCTSTYAPYIESGPRATSVHHHRSQSFACRKVAACMCSYSSLTMSLPAKHARIVCYRCAAGCRDHMITLCVIYSLYTL